MTETPADASALAMAEHWRRAAEDGLVNAKTAGTLIGACRSVLALRGAGWETLDVRALDLDECVRAFREAYAERFKARSLRDYESRFRRAVGAFCAYLDEPDGWRYPLPGGPALDGGGAGARGACAPGSAAPARGRRGGDLAGVRVPVPAGGARARRVAGRCDGRGDRAPRRVGAHARRRLRARVGGCSRSAQRERSGALGGAPCGRRGGPRSPAGDEGDERGGR